jgi:alpha-galactosidase
MTTTKKWLVYSHGYVSLDRGNHVGFYTFARSLRGQAMFCDRVTRLWRNCITAGLAALVLLATSRAEQVRGVEISPDELAMKSTWVKDHLLATDKSPPFSFKFGSSVRSNFFRAWPREASEKRLGGDRTERVSTWRDEKSGLEVRCVSIDYDLFPVVEWTVYIKNTGKKRTPLLQDIEGLDIVLRERAAGDFVLHGIKGDFCTADSFEPFQLQITPDFAKSFSPYAYSGKSSDGPDGWPYHNLQTSDGGMIIAVGWPGQWESSFKRIGKNGLHITAGQQLTRLVLEPGEEIRTPLIALLFYQGDDVVRSQNLWRRWYLAHVIPQVDGKPQPPINQVQVGGNDTSYVQSFLDAGVHIDICWRDAGGTNTWYPSDKGPYAPKEGEPNNQWLNTGTWEIDRTKYPNGFKPFSDWCHEHGIDFLLWFEPERIGSRETFLGQRPEWLLPATDMTVGDILNLGNPDALKWLVDHIDGMIKSEGIDWYREDMNGNGPLTAWRAADAEDRQGMTENLYVQGHLSFWDELLQRNPGLSIDSCASGGRRNDLETMRRSVPLLRSDFQFPDSQQGVFEGNQCHTYGLSSWLPFQGTGVYRYTPYELRSFYLAGFGMGSLGPENLQAQVKAYEECSKIAPFMLLGDYYPLTPYSLANDVWMGWQFHRSEDGEGAVQAFRREGAEESSVRLKLRGLEPEASYEVTNLDGGSHSATGQELMDDGLEIALEPRSAAIYFYKIKTSQGG